MRTSVKTYEEWSLFKKELTPDEEYQKAKKKAEKDKVKPGNAPEVEPGEEDDKPSKKVNVRDDYGEESWEEDDRYRKSPC